MATDTKADASANEHGTSNQGLVLEIGGDEFIITLPDGTQVRRPVDIEVDYPFQVVDHIRMLANGAPHVTIAGNQPIKITGGTQPAFMAAQLLPTKMVTLNERTIHAELDAQIPMQLTGSLELLAAWLASGNCAGMPVSRGGANLALANRFGLMQIVPTRTTTLLRSCAMDNGNMYGLQELALTLFPNTRIMHTLDDLLEQAHGVAICFTPHPEHTSLGIMLERMLQQSLNTQAKPVALYTDPLAVASMTPSVWQR